MNLELNKILIYVFLLTYLKPMNATLYEPLDFAYKILKVIVTLVLIILCIKKSVHISKNSKWCLLFLVVWSISIFLNTKSINSYGQEILSIVGVILLCNYCAKINKGIYKLLKALSDIGKIYILLNFITVLLGHPLFFNEKVIYVKYFLGSDNYSAFILIPLCGFILSNDIINCNKIKIHTWIIAFLGLLSLIIPFSVTGMIAYGMFLIIMLIYNYVFVRKVYSVKNIVIVGVCFLLLIMIKDVQEYISQMLILGKRGLNSRQIIWPLAVKAIIKRPILGYGSLTQEQISSYMLYGTTHTHNIFLEFIFDTGIIGSIIATIWAYNIFNKITKIRDNTMNCLMICMSSYVLCALFDFYIGLIYFWLLVIFIDIYKEQGVKRSVIREKI